MAPGPGGPFQPQAWNRDAVPSEMIGFRIVLKERGRQILGRIWNNATIIQKTHQAV